VQVFGRYERRFFSFEPSPRAFAGLAAAIARLDAGDAVSAHNFGLGDKEETLPLYANVAGAEIGSLYPRKLDHIGIAMKPLETVAIRTVDQFAREQGIERLHFLKIDTEGHELKCLQGARGMIDAGRIDFIQFEMGCNIDARTYLRDFWYALPNYRLARILRDGLYEFDAYSEIDEQIGTQNLLATLRT
jgi:FkbM family methyltransferase